MIKTLLWTSCDKTWYYISYVKNALHGTCWLIGKSVVLVRVEFKNSMYLYKVKCDTTELFFYIIFIKNTLNCLNNKTNQQQYLILTNVILNVIFVLICRFWIWIVHCFSEQNIWMIKIRRKRNTIKYQQIMRSVLICIRYFWTIKMVSNLTIYRSTRFIRIWYGEQHLFN